VIVVSSTARRLTGIISSDLVPHFPRAPDSQKKHKYLKVGY
jgi:hypothetical protein